MVVKCGLNDPCINALGGVLTGWPLSLPLHLECAIKGVWLALGGVIINTVVLMGLD